MPYLDLTTTAQIHAIMAAELEDIEEATIEAQGLDDDLLVALTSALPTWAAVRDDDTKPANQARLRIFAKYFCAGTVTFMAQVIYLKKSTDGNNESGRSDKDGWGFIAQGFMAKATEAMDGLLEDLGLAPEATPLSIIGRVIPDRDPITEPRS